MNKYKNTYWLQNTATNYVCFNTFCKLKLDCTVLIYSIFNQLNGMNRLSYLSTEIGSFPSSLMNKFGTAI